MRLTNHLQALERKLHDARSVKSSRSGKTQSTAPSRVSSTRSRLLETSSKATKLEVEMQFIAQEAEVRRLQLEKEIALARAEEKAIKKISNHLKLMEQALESYWLSRQNKQSSAHLSLTNKR